MVGVGAEDEVENDLGQPAEHVDPKVDVTTPELILNCCRILHQEDENVSCDDYAVEKEHCLSCQNEFEEVIETTNG